MKRTSFVLLLLLLATLRVYSASIEKNGITYNLNEENNTAEITSCRTDISGDIIIPSQVTYNDVSYSVTSIGSSFYECSSLTSITIPNSVTRIEGGLFSRCSSLTSIIVEEGNPVYDSRDNCNAIIHTETNTLIAGCKNTIIPNSVTSIGDLAFYNCTSLTSITIPNSVTSIGDYAFNNCTSLTSITIPNSVTSIGNMAFYMCDRLSSITIPSSVTSIGSSAFDTYSYYGAVDVKVVISDYSTFCNNTLITKLGNSLSSVRNYNIHLIDINGNEIKDFVIPDGVTSIGKYAFFKCNNLTSITIPNSVTSIEESAFYGCSGLTSITIPNNVTSIESYTFYDCSGLTSCSIPNSVTSIGYQAFYGCSNLNFISIPNSVTTIENMAFYGCNNLVLEIIVTDFSSYYNMRKFINPDANQTIKLKGTVGNEIKEFVIPDGVTSIGQNAFAGCSGLTSITIPSSVTTIGNDAFSGCSGLTSITIPSSVTSIGQDAFNGCNNLVLEIVVTDFSSYYNMRKLIKPDANQTIKLKGTVGNEIKEFVIPDGVTSIGQNAFAGCSGLTSITIPNSVTNIGNNAFSGCSSLTSITIPNSVTSIGNNSFSGCSGLTSITIPNSITSIGQNAFSGCNNLAFEFVVDDFASFCNLRSLINPETNQTITLKDTDGNEIKEIVIPEGVTSIENYEFSGCSGLTSITLPGTVTSIGIYAFKACSGLTSITIPEGVTSIEEAAFYGCLGLDTVFINSNAIVSKNYTRYSYSNGFSSIFGTQVKKYVLGQSVTSIGDYAFYNCSGLSAVTIPNSITSIGNNAFYGCNNLVFEIVVTDLSAFCNNNIMNNIRNIGRPSLLIDANGNEIKEIVIPEGVTSIASYAFYGCNGLTAITIPESVTSIGEAAFNGCSGLDTVYINSNAIVSNNYGDYYEYNNCFSSIFGSQVKMYVLGESITSIGNSAFRGCSGLTSFTIPNNVTSIGSYAFYSCSGLTSIAIPGSVTSIGQNAFYGCNNLVFEIVVTDLTAFCNNKVMYNIRQLGRPFQLLDANGNEIKEIVIPEEVTSIGSYAFYGCNGLTSITIPSSVTSIGYYAFNGCSGLTSITIPEGVTSIEEAAFYGCLGLDTVFINSNAIVSKNYTRNSKYYNGSYTYYCNGFSSIFGTQVKKYVLGQSVTRIGNYAFYDCSSLIAITIPESVTSIGDYAFYNCSGLSAVTIPNNVTSIGQGAFYGCNNLVFEIVVTDISAFCNNNVMYSIIGVGIPFQLIDANGNEIKEIVIPEGITSIGSYAFFGCSGLTSVTIPNSVTSIGDGVFGGCCGLTSISIPEGVTSIGDYTFTDCTGLTSINIPNNVTTIGNYAFSGCGGLTSINIPDGVTNIGIYAFDGCSSLASITIPNGVTSIRDGAFRGCRGLTSFTIPNSVTSVGSHAFYGCSRFTSITVPNSVTSIGIYAFSGCSGITSITIPNSVTSLGSYAFYDCSSLDTVFINSNAIVSIDYECIYDYDYNYGYYFDYCTGFSSIFGTQVKKYVLGESVTSIGNYAFWGCNDLTSITIPGSVMRIGNNAFYKENNNDTVQVKVVVSDYSAFCNNIVCSSIYYYPSTTHLVDSDGNEIKDYIVPEGITSIGDGAFHGCSELTSIKMPNSVTNIGDNAFSGCIGLSFITIPDSITRIGYKTFYGCSGITSITIPNNVTSIESGAFYYCSGLTSINIPDSVTSIGGSAFYGCSGLTSIIIPESVTSIGNGAFAGCKLETVFAKNPLTTLPNAFSDRTFQHAMLYIPVGTWRQAIYDGDWYQFNNIREVTTNSQSLSPTRAYTMMRAQDYKYAIYNGADNNVNIVNAFYSVDEDDPNSSWQIIDQTGGKSVMNIGSKKYLNVLADGKLALSDSPVILNMSDTDGAIAINGAEQEWIFVTNNNINVASGDNPTKVDAWKDNSSVSGEYYSIDGIKLSEPRNGLNIIRTQDGKTKKILNNR